MKAKVSEERATGESKLVLGGVGGKGLYCQNPANIPLSQEEVPMVQTCSVVFQLGKQVKIQLRGNGRDSFHLQLTHSAKYILYQHVLCFHTAEEPAGGAAPTFPAAIPCPQQWPNQMVPVGVESPQQSKAMCSASQH